MAGLKYDKMPSSDKKTTPRAKPGEGYINGRKIVASKPRSRRRRVAQPDNDPMTFVKKTSEANYQSIKRKYSGQDRILRSMGLSADEYRQKREQLQIGFDEEVQTEQMNFKNKEQQFKRIAAMQTTGRLSETEANQLLWDFAGSEVEDRVRQVESRRKAPKKQRPMSISTLTSKSMTEAIESHAEGAADERGLEWGDPKKEAGSLMQQYDKFRKLIGYSEFDPIVQTQVDRQWDDFMRGDNRYENWFDDKKKTKPVLDVQINRPAGEIGRAMQSRMGGSGGPSNIGRVAQSTTTRQPPRQPKEQTQREQLTDDARKERLRAAGTEEAYKQGVKLGYWE